MEQAEGGNRMSMEAMMTPDEINKAKATLVNLERLHGYWLQQQADAEMRVLLLAHEASRVAEEITVTKLMLGLSEVSSALSGITGDIKDIIATTAHASETTPVSREPQP